MYLVKVTLDKVINDLEIKDNDDEQIIFTWRKHPNLHGYMEELYVKKGGRDTFNRRPIRLTYLDLARLEKVVEQNDLPPTAGFFFGESSPDDKVDDLKAIAVAREAIENGYAIYYDSWW